MKISTTLIQVDVTVTDSKGRIVRDLKSGDFAIYENGEKQTISDFSFVPGVRTSEAAQISVGSANSGILPPPRTLRAEQVRRTIALVVDDLTLSFQSAVRVRTALRKYVDEQLRNGDLVAIIRTGGGIGALQQFTSNKQQLYSAIEKVRWNPRGRGRTGGSFEAVNELPESIKQQDAEDKKAEEDFQKSFTDFQESIFATGTLGALRFVVRGMSQLPGRKSVVLFSEGVPIIAQSESGSSAASSTLDFIRRIVAEANRASIVFYAIDTRGVEYTGLTAADKVMLNPNAMGRTMSARGNELFETQQSLAILSNETGGFPVFNQNDIPEAIRKIFDDQSYYLIAYQPDSGTFDAKTRRFNKLEVKVRRPGVTVRYRSGFFSVPEEDLINTRQAGSQTQQLNLALSSPFAVNDISLNMNALYGNNNQGNFVTALLHIDTGDLQFTDGPGGTKKAIIDILAITFGDNGVPVDQFARTFTFDIQPRAFNDVLKNGFLCNFTFPVTRPGPYQFRVAVRDAQARKVGSASQFVEIPDLKKDRLTLSGLLLENFNKSQWQLFSGEKTAMTPVNELAVAETDPFTDTSLRKFKSGTVLRFGYDIYNAKLDPSRKTYLKAKLRIYKDDKLVTDGVFLPVQVEGQSDLSRIKAGGAIRLVDNMEPGDYVLQIIVMDELRKDSGRTASQLVQFEIIR